jgi:hypothetical protein
MLAGYYYHHFHYYSDLLLSPIGYYPRREQGLADHGKYSAGSRTFPVSNASDLGSGLIRSLAIVATRNPWWKQGAAGQRRLNS